MSRVTFERQAVTCPFAVHVERAAGYHERFQIYTTVNGYQWSSVGLPMRDAVKAEQLATQIYEAMVGDAHKEDREARERMKD